jgi:hypothetical protein
VHGGGVQCTNICNRRDTTEMRVTSVRLPDRAMTGHQTSVVLSLSIVYRTSVKYKTEVRWDCHRPRRLLLCQTLWQCILHSPIEIVPLFVVDHCQTTSFLGLACPAAARSPTPWPLPGLTEPTPASRHSDPRLHLQRSTTSHCDVCASFSTPTDSTDHSGTAGLPRQPKE